MGIKNFFIKIGKKFKKKKDKQKDKITKGKAWEPTVNNKPIMDIDLNKVPPSLKNFKERYNAFETLVQENFKALEGIDAIRNSLSGGAEPVITCYISTIEAIRKMAWCYSAMSGTKPQLLNSKIWETNRAVASAIESIDMSLRFGYKKMVTLYSGTLFEKIEKLSDEIQYPDEYCFELANCRTVHDLVRYFHQKGNDELFNFNRGGFESIPVKGARFLIGDIGGALDPGEDYSIKTKHIKSKPLLAIIDFYEHKRSKGKGGHETYKVIANASRIRTSCKMGYHGAEIDAQVDDAESFVYLKFCDNDTKKFKKAKYRTAYVRGVLNRLDFKLANKGRITHAALEGKTAEQTYDTITEVAALMASTRDLDLSCSPLKAGNIDKAVEKFFKGCVNLYSMKLR